MDELIRDFLVDTAEALALLDSELVQLEARPGDACILSSVFRKLHTIKGTCGFLGFPKLGRLAHAGETVLGGLRDATLETTPRVIDVIFRCVDAIKDLVATIETTGAEGPADHAPLLAELGALFDGRRAEHLAPAGLPAPPAAEPVAEASADPGGAASPPPSDARTETAAPARDAALAGQTVRVTIGLLEELMTEVSELVLTRNQLLQLVRGETDSAFRGPLQRLSVITSALQNSIMKARMQPVGAAWAGLPRLVRDLAQELGKKIELHMEGADTELDRQVLELIKDPLTHMVRNAADHGLEPPAARRAAGKAETGHIRLHAFHDGGHSVIEVSDDGNGLDVERIRRKAIQSGLAGAAEAASLPDAEIFRFIMRPGFSTAAAVTAVSGRGVGMDVVRANIEKIGGTIDIASRPGQGATFTIRIPRTLAILSALIVSCAGERFAVPHTAVAEIVRAGQGGLHRIERLRGAEVLCLRGRLLPLINLHSLLALDSAEAAADDTLVILTQAGTWPFGLVVDEVFETEDLVVRPLTPLPRRPGVYSGTTILADGSVCMILDPVGLAASQGQIERGAATQAGPDMNVVKRDSAQDSMRKAVPLDLVAHIDEIDVAAIHST